jgi:alanine-synthesizing transaminase
MFSSRFKWTLETNQLTQLIEEKKRVGINILDLTETNPTKAGFQLSLPFLINSESLIYQPDPRGLLATREAVAKYYAESRAQKISPEQIFLTASTSEAYSWLFKLLCDNGAEVLIPQPSYPLFEFLAELENVKISPYSLDYSHDHGWSLDVERLEKLITPKTKAVIVVNPNNPTGSYLKVAEWEKLQAICASKKIAIMVDEVFFDYSFQNIEAPNLNFSEAPALTFVMNGLSKMLALPQMKLGWISVFGEQKLRAEAQEKLEIIADTFLSVNTPVQVAAPAWLKSQTVIQAPIKLRIEENLQYLQQTFSGSNCRVLQAEGGWCAIIEIPRIESEEEIVLKLLQDYNLLAHPGYFFDFEKEGYLVVSLIVKPEAFREGVIIMRDYFAL